MSEHRDAQESDDRDAGGASPSTPARSVPDWQARPGDHSPFGSRPTQQIGHSSQVHPPPRSGTDIERARPGLAARLGIPALGGTIVAASSMLLGLGNVIAGPLDTLAVGLGLGVLAASGTGLLVRRRRRRRSGAPTVPGIEASADIEPRTRERLEGILAAAADTRRQITDLREDTTEPRARRALADAEALTDRIGALTGSEAIRGRSALDGSLTMLDGIATRYLPDLVEATARNIGFLSTFSGDARAEALDNLGSVDRQLGVLGEGLERIESDVVAGTSHSLEVHAEFLRSRFADQHLPTIIDP